MPTNGERQALVFLTAVALLGIGARACRERQESPPPKELDRQIASVESRPARRDRARANPARRDSTSGTTGSSPPPTVSGRIDIDAATVNELARVPGISRALAKRIAADRTASGAFGCLAALDQVKGVGAATLKRLDSLVTFSGAPRTACVQH
jgi:competence protein ComEA